MQGHYLAFPRDLHGKLFFSLGASNFVCSATVVFRSTIATAGHCVSNGAGLFATNVLFCLSGRRAPLAWLLGLGPDLDYESVAHHGRPRL
jgi:hypothetical protein